MERTDPITTELPHTDDEFRMLMEAAKSGDEQAIAKICRYYEPIVRVTARLKLGPALRPHFDSVDLVQSVHRSLLMGIRDQKFSITSPNKLIALAKAMVHRKIGRKWRKASRQTRLSGTGTDSDSMEQQLHGLVAVNDDNSVDVRDQISCLCELLSSEESRVLELRMKGYNATEIAAFMDMHPVAVRVRWSRLRKRLERAGITPDWFD